MAQILVFLVTVYFTSIRYPRDLGISIFTIWIGHFGGLEIGLDVFPVDREKTELGQSDVACIALFSFLISVGEHQGALPLCYMLASFTYDLIEKHSNESVIEITLSCLYLDVPSHSCACV